MRLIRPAIESSDDHSIITRIDKMSKKYVCAAFISASSIFSLPTLASTYISCDSCSYTQMRNTAIAHGVGRFVVGNILSQQVQAFQVRSGVVAKVIGRSATENLVASNNVIGGANLIADLSDLTPSESAAFSAYVRFYNYSPVGYHKQINLTIVPMGAAVGVANIPSDVTNSNRMIVKGQMAGKDITYGITPMSVPVSGGGTVTYPTPGANAYSVINNGPTQNAFLTWVASLASFNVDNIINTGLSALAVFNITDVNNVPVVSITVTFTDKSHVGVYIDNTQQPPQVKLNPDTAVDSHGNNIPASAPAVAGNGRQEYQFTGAGAGGDRGSMGAQIGGFRISVPAHSLHYSCGSVNGGRIECVAY